MKPLIAIAIVIVLAWLGLYLWHLPDAAVPDPNQPDPPSPPADNTAGDGLEREWVKLSDLPQRDPEELWPRDGMRLSWPDFWVVWRTRDFGPCRLLAGRDRRLWYSCGQTGGRRHFLTVDLSRLDSRAWYAVEFERGGKSYRSRARRVSYGEGAHFALRQITVHARLGERTEVSVRLDGHDPGTLPSDSWFFYLFPDDLIVQVAAPYGDESGGDVRIYVTPTPDFNADSASGFLQVYDPAGETYDRLLIQVELE